MVCKCLLARVGACALCVREGGGEGEGGREGGCVFRYSLVGLETVIVPNKPFLTWRA